MSDRFYYLLAVRMASDLTITIAAPALLAALIGTRIDSYLGSKPWGLLSCLVVALTITAVIVNRKIRHYGHLYNQGDKKGK